MAAPTASSAQTISSDAPIGTLIITRREVSRLLTLDECIATVEDAFRAHGNGIAPAPAVLGVHAGTGGFHIKAAALQLDRMYFAAKTNSNFPLNRASQDLPTIQGMIALFDASCGYPLALMDSIEITRLRTAAATAVAAKFLARDDVRTIALLGCGDQAPLQLEAMLRVRQPRHVCLYDVAPQRAIDLARRITRDLAIKVSVADDVLSAVRISEICITCTPSKHHIVNQGWVLPGTFIAAVGADSEDKCEIDPRLLAGNKVVADVLSQCAAIGDLQHAINAGLMLPSDVYAELGEVVAGRKAGRVSDDEIIIFDSTGTALQDVAAAAAVYRNALRAGGGTTVNLNDISQS